MQQDKPIRAGVFESEPGAERAVAGLLEAGFPQDAIKLVASTPLPASSEIPHVESVQPSGSHTAGAVALGAAVGAVLGGATAAVGTALAGDFGPTVVASAAVAATAGGVVGGFIGAMLTRGYEPEIADYYDQSLEKGQFLVAVEEREGAPPLTRAEAVFLRVGVEPVPLARS